MRDYKNEKTNKNDNMSREKYLYHNTELLLKKYRDVVWSIEVSVAQAEINFELEMDCKLAEFLKISYATGADLSGTQIQEQIRTLERNKKMLKMIETALNILHKRQDKGEEYYWILYYTYITEKPSKRVDDIIKLVEEKTDYLSWKKYYKLKKEAIQILGSILWGFTTKDCLPMLEDFLS